MYGHPRLNDRNVCIVDKIRMHNNAVDRRKILCIDLHIILLVEICHLERFGRLSVGLKSRRMTALVRAARLKGTV